MIIIPRLSRPLESVSKHVVSWNDSDDHLSVDVGGHVRWASCPRCGRVSSRMHSRYQRRLADAPSFGRPVTLTVEMHRFKCVNDECPQQTFCERLDPVAGAGQRRTKRLREAQRALGYALGGAAAARLATRLGMRTSRHTVLRELRSAGCPGPASAPVVVGIDDWAIARGHRYVGKEVPTRSTLAPWGPLVADARLGTLYLAIGARQWPVERRSAAAGFKLARRPLGREHLDLAFIARRLPAAYIWSIRVGMPAPSEEHAMPSQDASSKPRQAVVVIHGIGEQRPMQTLRGFVSTLLRAPPKRQRWRRWFSKSAASEDAPEPRFFSKPDRLTDTLELRRLTASKHFVTAPTDFYELYWAHLMEGTVWSHIVAWLRMLMFRVPLGARTPIKLLWFASWGLVIVAGVMAYRHQLPASAQDLIGYGILGILALATLRFLGGIGLHYVGDAARYLSPTPQNINARKNIRNAVIQLLTKLHEERPARYERIIVVGHSLGSVIAYDALTHLWQMRHSRINEPKPMVQPRMQAALEHGEALSTPRPESDEFAATRDAYRKAQRELLAEQKLVGVDWNISDLVTLGSPLTHASFLLASGQEEWAELKRERAYPTSPPQLEDPRDTGLTIKHFVFKDERRFDLHILHHAALFACTRWTNLYFPSDPIGGPVCGVNGFGLGVKDVPLQPRNWATRLTPLAHVRYWDPRETHAVDALSAAMDLADTLSPPAAPDSTSGEPAASTAQETLA